MLIFACILLLFVGLAHSYLGEKYILIRLFKRDNLPHTLGSDWFTKRVLRFAWHLTTLTWWGFSAILYVIFSDSTHLTGDILIIVSVVFFLSGLVSFSFSKGKHLSWVFFFLIAGSSFYAAV